MIFSYRTRHILRQLGKILLIILAIAAALLVCFMVWAGRYMAYDRDAGALLDFNMGPIPEGVLATPPSPTVSPNIYYKDPTSDLPNNELKQTSIQGYYLTAEDLRSEKLPELKSRLETLKAGTAVMLEVKAPKGWFYFSTEIDDHYEDQAPKYALSVQEMDDLIKFMDSRGLYMVARLSAFRDYWFGRYHVSSGLPEKGKGGALWMDNGCYWLNPTDDETLNYLVRITRELKALGFDEVVYDDFRFPVTDKVFFTGNQAQSIVYAAVTIATACATDQFCVSFAVSDPTFPLPEGNCRLYFQGVAAADAETVAQQVMTDSAASHVLFMTTASDASDTRFEKYSVLRPLESAL